MRQREDFWIRIFCLKQPANGQEYHRLMTKKTVYQQTLDYIYEKLPMYHLVGGLAYKEDIGNITLLCEYQGNPQQKFKSVHVAGTNGKGSVCHLMASALMSSGYKTGLFTSPHLLDFRERIKINGQAVSEEYVTGFIENNKVLIEKIKPSFFEITAVLALSWFADEKVDLTVIETGLGGRLDATNILHPELSVITNISLDHEHMLGDTIEKIAYEKAGIIKDNTPVVIGEKKWVTQNVFEKIAEAHKSALYFAEDYYSVQFVNRDHESINFLVTDLLNNRAYNLNCDLTGTWQSKNIMTVLKGLDILRSKNFVLPEISVYSGISNTKKNTLLNGRWDVLHVSPMIVCDISHNPAAIHETISQLEEYTYNKLHIVFGLSADKNLDSILNELPANAIYYFCRPSVARGLDQDILKQKASEKNLVGNAFATVADGLSQAIGIAKNNDFILVTGSTFVVADAMKMMK